MPKDRMAFWASFLPDAYRKLRPDGIWIHDLPYWSNALSAEVGRHTGDVLIKYDPRDVSRIFIQHPVSGHFIEARARNLGFPAISLREWRLARKAQRQKGRRERDDDQLMRTALAQRQIVADAIAKTATARKTPPRSEIIGDGFDSGSMTGIDSRIPSALELLERLPDVQTKPSDR
jgi:putative transposase